MRKVIIEEVGREKCINGRTLYLIYENEEDRKFAPQYLLSETQLSLRLQEYEKDGISIMLIGMKK